MTTASTKLGTLTSRINSQQTFVKALMDANTSAVGTLVDANMEEESTKLKALQTQQQLGRAVAVDRQRQHAEHLDAVPPSHTRFDPAPPGPTGDPKGRVSATRPFPF